MSRKLSPVTILILLLIITATFAINVGPTKATEVIYIMADGSIYPQTANISSDDNTTYIFTDNINGSLVIERNNIIIDGAGYILQGIGNGTGIDLTEGANVTIKNMLITGFSTGILLYQSNHSRITKNRIMNNGQGIALENFSMNNTISENTVAENEDGIMLDSPYSIFFHNNFINNTLQVNIGEPSLTNFWDNDYPLGGNYWSNYNGTDFNRGIYQNITGIDGIADTEYTIDSNNIDHYPLMGPFGPLTLKGRKIAVFPTSIVGLIFENVTAGGSTTVNETETGPPLPSGFMLLGKYYDIQTTAGYLDNITIRIRYSTSIAGDINNDRYLNAKDVVIFGQAFGSSVGDPIWNKDADLNEDGYVNGDDAIILGVHFGQHLTEEEEKTLQLAQWNETTHEWTNRTLHVDTENDVIYGETSHLSIYGVHQ